MYYTFVLDINYTYLFLFLINTLAEQWKSANIAAPWSFFHSFPGKYYFFYFCCIIKISAPNMYLLYSQSLAGLTFCDVRQCFLADNVYFVWAVSEDSYLCPLGQDHHSHHPSSAFLRGPLLRTLGNLESLGRKSPPPGSPAELVVVRLGKFWQFADHVTESLLRLRPG